MYKIMIVEDDEVIANTLKKHLARWDFAVVVVRDFQNVLNEYLREQPDLVLLDVYLPFYNGYHWCAKIRELAQVPIVFISSANENMNIVMAMNMGGDDFINKPFDLNVITAKIQAILRRSYSFAKESYALAFQDILLDLATGEVTYQDLKLELTKNEVKIMELFFQKPQTIITREELMNFLWDDCQFVDDNTLSVNINRLRKKLETIGLNDLIKTRKGMGYLFG